MARHFHPHSPSLRRSMHDSLQYYHNELKKRPRDLQCNAMVGNLVLNTKGGNVEEAKTYLNRAFAEASPS